MNTELEKKEGGSCQEKVSACDGQKTKSKDETAKVEACQTALDKQETVKSGCCGS